MKINIILLSILFFASMLIGCNEDAEDVEGNEVGLTISIDYSHEKNHFEWNSQAQSNVITSSDEYQISIVFAITEFPTNDDSYFGNPIEINNHGEFTAELDGEFYDLFDYKGLRWISGQPYYELRLTAVPAAGTIMSIRFSGESVAEVDLPFPQLSQFSSNMDTQYNMASDDLELHWNSQHVNNLRYTGRHCAKYPNLDVTSLTQYTVESGTVWCSSTIDYINVELKGKIPSEVIDDVEHSFSFVRLNADESFVQLLELQK